MANKDLRFQILSLMMAFVFLTNCVQGVKIYNKTNKIFGGYLVGIAKYPFMVNLINKRVEGVCGGTIIAPNCVLTAAHCVDNTPLDKIVLCAGSKFLKNNEIKQAVEAIHLHPDYNSATVDADIAVLRLKRPLKGKYIEPIEVDTNQLKTNDAVIALGWGDTELNEVSTQLRAVNLTVASQMECMQRYSGHITGNMFCAKGPKGKDTCKGDSGGPVIRNGKQVGIVSWGRGCGNARFPGVYTRLSARAISNKLHRWISMHCT